MDRNETKKHLMIENSRHLSLGGIKTYNNDITNQQVDSGLIRNWSESFGSGTRDSDTMDGEQYTECVKQDYYKDNGCETIVLPKKKNGIEYKLEDRGPIDGDNVSKQQAILVAAFDTIIKFLTNDKMYQPLCATILHRDGTGKSFIINTLITLVQKYTNCKDVV